MYQTIYNQPKRLGNFEQFGEFGQEVATSIAAVGNAVVGVTDAIVAGQTTRAVSADQAKVAIVTQIEQTKQSAITTSADVTEATTGVAYQTQQIATKFSGITQMILIIGVALAGLMLAGAFSYKITK